MTIDQILTAWDGASGKQKCELLKVLAKEGRFDFIDGIGPDRIAETFNSDNILFWEFGSILSEAMSNLLPSEITHHWGHKSERAREQYHATPKAEVEATETKLKTLFLAFDQLDTRKKKIDELKRLRDDTNGFHGYILYSNCFRDYRAKHINEKLDEYKQRLGPDSFSELVSSDPLLEKDVQTAMDFIGEHIALYLDSGSAYDYVRKLSPNHLSEEDTEKLKETKCPEHYKKITGLHKKFRDWFDRELLQKLGGKITKDDWDTDREEHSALSYLVSQTIGMVGRCYDFNFSAKLEFSSNRYFCVEDVRTCLDKSFELYDGRNGPLTDNIKKIITNTLVGLKEQRPF